MPKQDAKQCGSKFTYKLLHPRFWLTWLALGLTAVFAQLPNKSRHFMGRLMGQYIYKYNSKRRHIIETNLKLAFPELEHKARDAMTLKNLQWYACAMLNYSLLFFASNQRLASMLTIDGQEHIDKALQNQKPVMILLAHSLMLEFAPVALGQRYECFGSYKSSKNAVLDWLISKARCRHVTFVVSREEGLRKLVKSLAPGKLMIFLPDEDLGRENAVFAPFFKQQKATLTTTSRIAKLGKAVAMPAFSWFDNKTNKYRVEILPPLDSFASNDVLADATALNKALEHLIKKHPEQYMWQMKWYKTRPENEASIY